MTRLFQIAAVLAALVFLSAPVLAAQAQDGKPAASALVRLLVARKAAGVAASPAESDKRLASLLLAKGLINQAEYTEAVGGEPVTTKAPGHKATVNSIWLRR